MTNLEELEGDSYGDEKSDEDEKEDEGLVELDHKTYDLAQAKETKDQANQIIKENGDIYEAIRLYRQSVDLCPPNEKSEMAIFHNNLGIAFNKAEKPL